MFHQEMLILNSNFPKKIRSEKPEELLFDQDEFNKYLKTEIESENDYTVHIPEQQQPLKENLQEDPTSEEEEEE